MKLIVKEMKLLGLTHKDAALKIGVSEKTIGNWVSGSCLPAVKNIKSMVRAGFSELAILCPTMEVDI